MLERDLQTYLYENPHVLFPGQDIQEKHWEFKIDGRRIDLLFHVNGLRYIVELKRQTIRREDVGQVMEYYGRMRRLGNGRDLRMILVAPSIPKYWSLSLEEFGIRCIEVAKPPISMTQRTEITKQATGQRRKMAAEDDMLSRLGDVSSVSFQEMLPPVSRKSLALSHLFLRSSLESVNRRFSNYQVVPVKMVTSNSQDVLCFGFKHPTESPSFTKAGSWWAYALGRSEEMPKNDLPNISVSAMPWALDVAINAELRTSQLVIRRRITARPRDFDALLSSLPKMHFQAWLKLEHQPFFYHWIPTSLCRPGDWNAASVIDGITQSEKNFLSIRNEAISWIKKRRPELSLSQASHMERRNQALNLALRFVLPFEKRDPFWALTLDEQIELLNLTYVTLKPMMDFFHANEV